MERPDFVSHHAAQMDVRRSIVEPLFDADVNILGSINLIECARGFHVKRFVYISTGGAVYGEPVYLPCDEAHPINPICQYGASKHTVEHYLYMYKQNYGSGLRCFALSQCLWSAPGPEGRSGCGGDLHRADARGKQVMINGDGEQERDFRVCR